MKSLLSSFFEQALSNPLSVKKVMEANGSEKGLWRLYCCRLSSTLHVPRLAQMYRSAPAVPRRPGLRGLDDSTTQYFTMAGKTLVHCEIRPTNAQKLIRWGNFLAKSLEHFVIVREDPTPRADQQRMFWDREICFCDISCATKATQESGIVALKGNLHTYLPINKALPTQSIG